MAALMLGIGGWIWWASNAKQRLGEEVVSKVENFRITHQRLPESLAEIGIEVKSESDPPVYYRKESSGRYTVWYGLSLGESMTYDSATGKWEDHN
jgi:hypothetical protein